MYRTIVQVAGLGLQSAEDYRRSGPGCATLLSMRDEDQVQEPEHTTSYRLDHSWSFDGEDHVISVAAYELRIKRTARLVLGAQSPGRPGNGLSDSSEPAGDRPSDLVGTVLLHEVETFDDDAVLVREAAGQSLDPARDEYAGLRIDKQLRQRCCSQPCRVGGDPLVDIGRLARQRHLARPLQCWPAIVAARQEWSPVLGHLVG